MKFRMSQRMVHGVLKRISLSLLPLLATTAFAQNAPDDEALPEVRRYTVEMIIFAYKQNVATGSEIFVPDEPPPVNPMLEGEIRDSDRLSDSLPLEELRNKKRRYELVMLEEKDFTLLDAFERLDNLGAYKPLLHFGWTQPTYPEEDTEVRALSSFVRPPAGLEGELKLYLSRYLHLALNLQMDAPVDKTVQEDTFGDRFFAASDGEEVISYPVRYRINEDRIFRNGELRYYDHPKFGVLAKITRVEEEEPGEEELLGESEFLGFDGE